MTATTNTPPGAPEQQKPETVDLTIDGIPVTVEKNTLVIRAAEQVGIQIPRFCDHPLLDPVGACRQCLVEVAMPDREGNLKPMPKPQASCTMTVAPGMEVKTQVSSPVADKAQRGVMELLLINHPLDCPVCDKGGECPLQNQAMTAGRAISRFEDSKRTYPKPINISSQVLLDRERCVLCARCTRFSDQVAGDPFIALVERGALQQVGIYEEQPFESYFSGNTVQICPVGALTGAAYRFRSRPFDLVSTPTTCEHCASGCAIRTDHRRGTVLRRMAWNDPAVNEEWNCDKGRWAFQYTMVGDRIEHPMVRDASGALVVVSWDEALEAAAAGLRAAGTTGVLTGGRLVVEDAAAYARFAREVLGTGSIDFRSRPHSAEEAAFLVEHVLGTSPETGGVTYADVEHAGSVLLVGVEPEEESPILFLRLRKAYRRNGTKVAAVAPLSTRGLRKVGGALIPSAPGTEVEVLEALRADAPAETGGEAYRAAHEALRAEGAISSSASVWRPSRAPSRRLPGWRGPPARGWHGCPAAPVSAEPSRPAASRPVRACPPTACSMRPARASWAPSSSAAWSSPTSDAVGPPRTSPGPSSSPSSTAPATSRPSPTSSCRWRRTPSARAPSSTGRAGGARSRPPSRPVPWPTTSSSTGSPGTWGSSWAPGRCRRRTER